MTKFNTENPIPGATSKGRDNWEEPMVPKSYHDKLAVECVNVKASREVLAKNALETCNVVFSAGFRNTSLERGLMASTGNRNEYPNPIKALVDEAGKELLTPETDSALAELKAQGIELLADDLATPNPELADGTNNINKAVAWYCRQFAANLRAGGEMMINKNQSHDGVVCKGSLCLGSGCGSCSRCKAEIRGMFNDLRAQEAATRTLSSLGYTHTPGAELWRPPLGPKPDFTLLEAKDEEIRNLNAKLAKLKGDAVPVVIDAGIIRDANRYRFLRDEDAWGEDSDSWDVETKTGLISSENLMGGLSPDHFDAAIDARMAASDIPFFNPAQPVPVVVLPTDELFWSAVLDVLCQSERKTGWNVQLGHSDAFELGKFLVEILALRNVKSADGEGE